MKSILYFFYSCILLTATSSFGQSIHSNYVDGEVWVKVKPNTIINRTLDINSSETNDYHHINPKNVSFLGNITNRFSFSNVSRPYFMVSEEKINNIYKLEFTNAGDVEAILKALNENNSIEYAEKIPLLKKTLTPNDTDFNASDQWSLFQIQASAAWNIGTGNANIVVAIVDDAVEITHSDLSPVIWTNPGEVANNGIDDDNNGYVDDVQGFDVANMDNDPNPDGSSYDHGTHVAGIAGAASNNNNGIASLGYNLTLMAVKSTNSASAVTNGYDGVVYAVNSGADVINMSWGGSGSSTTANNIIDWAYNSGIVLVAAAGNDDVTTVFYPAGYTNCISVASTTYGDAKSSFSNYGSWIDISAPGSAIWSTIPGNTYGIKQGTSMASPLVASLCGLMLSTNPGLSPSDVESCLTSTADNIDAANASYIGQLGAGRINALSAMNCVTSTLNWAPIADFSPDLTNILEGQSVNFTNLSYYNPTSYSWSFSGGSPATSTSANPPSITYNTAGVYDVSLTVTNANGSDTKTVTGQITVTGLTGCDTITNTLPADPNNTWSWNGGNGLISGHNAYGMYQFCDKYTAYGPTSIMGAEFYFTRGETNSSSSMITVMVWEDNAGLPGTVVYTQDVSLELIEDNIVSAGAGSFYITNVDFDIPATVSTSNFYVGYTITNAPLATDSAACAMTGDLISAPGRPNTMYVNFAAGNPLAYPVGWVDIETVSGSQWSMHIYPRITQTPPQAIISPTPSTVCTGEWIVFDGTGSPNTVNWNWAINGTGTPYPTGSAPNVIMNTDGSHWVYMQAINSCGFDHIDSVQVTVNPTPSVGLSATATTICPGGNSDITASGATTYSWSPAGTLSGSTGATATAAPTTTTTYTVTGTTGGCSNYSDITIIIDDSNPDAAFIMDNDTICEGDAVNYNGAISDGGSNYTWTFVGGDISSSTDPNPSVVYSTQGTYSIDLTVENTCSQTDNITGSIVVLPASACVNGFSELTLQGVNAYYYNEGNLINVAFENSFDNVKLTLLNSLGQVSVKEQLLNVISGTTFEINTGSLSTGIYFLEVNNGVGNKVIKLSIQ